MNTPVFADNCQACGMEFLSIELIPVKLGSYSVSRICVCLPCLVKSNSYDDYKEAAELIMATSFMQKKSSFNARLAKEQLKKVLGRPDWMRGIGIGFSTNGEYCIKVNVQAMTTEIQQSIPSNVDGIPVVVDAVGNITAG